MNLLLVIKRQCGAMVVQSENILEPISKTHWNEFKTFTFGNQIVGFSDVLLHILTQENEYWKPAYA